jgi:hypothetical protein
MRTTPLDSRLLAMVLAIGFAVFSPAALGGYREQMHVTSVEIALLPQFCWGQFEVPNPQETTDFWAQDCGPAVNHYCPGLIYLIRGKRPAAKERPLPHIQHADVDVAYTERAIKDYPKCSIREHVDATRAEINHLLRMYGGKPVGAR